MKTNKKQPDVEIWTVANCKNCDLLIDKIKKRFPDLILQITQHTREELSQKGIDFVPVILDYRFNQTTFYYPNNAHKFFQT